MQAIWRQDCYELPTGGTSFGFKDGIGQPPVEGSGIPASNPLERPIKAGEFILGYPDETETFRPCPPHSVRAQRHVPRISEAAHPRRCVPALPPRQAADRHDEASLGAKIVGRWQSGALLVLAPDRDDPELGGDEARNNAFLYGNDRRGLKCPAGAHARRANPRDAFDGEGSVDVRLHRMIRRGTSYGPILPDGVLEDDGADRGIVFVFAGSHLKRQFEFVKTQWLNDGIFIGAPQEQDPLVGRPAGNGYVGTYLLLRIDDRRAGRELIRRLLPAVGSASASSDPAQNAWVTVGFTYQGFKALGMPKASLDSFAPEFRQGMAARAAELGDRGESSPENWEKPLGTPEVHVALAGLSPDAARLEARLERARRALEDLSGVEAIWRQDCYQLPTGRTSFGFKDGIGQPAVEGSGIPASNPLERPIKAGEFILGYPDETGELPPMPTPTVFGRNGTYLVFRKLHTRVAAYRRYLRDRAADRHEEALLGAKMVGRWQSGAPLVLAPDHDDPELGGDETRNNAFLYGHDRRGLKCPAGAHARRANPRDALDRGR